jgi:hypothetical protein
MAQLTGFALPVQGLRFWDHTYATSDDGHIWPCFGRSSGGSVVARGSGDSALADCLSRPIDMNKVPPVFAGLKYGLTGVCHQAVNRILYPAGITVAQARGYRFSFALYHQYGSGPWPELAGCVTMVSKGGSELKASQRPARSTVSKSKDARLSRRVLGIYSQPRVFERLGSDENALALGREEFRALTDTYLGEDYDQAKVAEVARLQQAMQLEQRTLARRFESGELDAETYLSSLNDLITRTFAQSEKVLGRADFAKLFGLPAAEAGNLVDRETFLRVPTRKPRDPAAASTKSRR